MKGIEDETISLKKYPPHILTTTFGDGSAVNMECVRLLEKKYVIKSPSSKCSNHLGSGTIKRMCTSVNNIQKGATALYENSHAMLKNIAMIPKSSELLSSKFIIL